MAQTTRLTGNEALPLLASLPDQPIRMTLRPRRILVVEDNLDGLHSLVLLLRDMGHEVDYAINGQVAVELAKKIKPDVIFLDLGLPGLDGFDVCSRIKAEPDLKATRVVAITGYAFDEHRVRSRAVGCELHLVKPVSPKILEELLG